MRVQSGSWAVECEGLLGKGTHRTGISYVWSGEKGETSQNPLRGKTCQQTGITLSA